MIDIKFTFFYKEKCIFCYTTQFFMHFLHKKIVYLQRLFVVFELYFLLQKTFEMRFLHYLYRVSQMLLIS